VCVVAIFPMWVVAELPRVCQAAITGCSAHAAARGFIWHWVGAISLATLRPTAACSLCFCCVKPLHLHVFQLATDEPQCAHRHWHSIGGLRHQQAAFGGGQLLAVRVCSSFREFEAARDCGCHRKRMHHHKALMCIKAIDRMSQDCRRNLIVNSS
jgi:hypothetical protein